MPTRTANPDGMSELSNNVVFTQAATAMTFNCVGKVEWGDVNGDGLLDFACPKPYLSPTSAVGLMLYMNNGDGLFTGVQPQLNFVSPEKIFSVVFGDVDNDGDLDMLLGIGGGESHQPSTNQIWHNDGSGNFAHGSAGSFTAAADNFKPKLVLGDYDDDVRRHGMRPAFRNPPSAPSLMRAPLDT